MIKNDQLTFKQLPPPILNKIMTINQPQKDLIFEHWRHLIAAIEVEGIANDTTTRNAFFLYKCKFHLGFINFQDGCFLYQKKFKIIYGQAHEITAIKFHLINIKFDEVKKKEVLVGIGFYDGSCEIYNLCVTEKAVILKKLLFLQNTSVNQPVTSIIFNRKNLYLSRLHNVIVYKDLLSATANMIIQEQINKDKSKETFYKFAIENLPLENMVNGAYITISTGLNSLYAFNETDGAKSIEFERLVINGSIIDSLVFVKEAYGENLILGDTSNFLKIIYHGRNYVERYAGFKNYCSSIDQVLFPNHEEIWVGDLYGAVTYFQRFLGVDSKPPTKNIKMIQIPIKYSFKLCENGIKEMRVIGKLLFVLDSESNIHIYDIIRKDALEHLKTVELESVEEYSSNQT